MIAVWLKIMNRKEGLDFVLYHLDFWLEAFEDKEKYDIFIYNENIENLPVKYNEYRILNKDEIINSSEDCARINGLTKTTPWIDDKWRGACAALSLPYWYLKNYEYCFGIDADDLILDCGDKIDYFLDKIEEVIVGSNLPVLSSDIYYSTPNNSWSFGITFANIEKFKKIIEKSLNLKTYEPGWARNLDFQIDQYFKLIEQQISPIAFTTEYRFIHGGEGGLKSYYDPIKKHCACDLYGKRIQYGSKQPRTLLIK
jgi:hypothetical protein